MNKSSTLLVTILLALVSTTRLSQAADPVDFNKQVKPVLESACLSCHDENHTKGDLRLDTKELAFKGGKGGKAIVAGTPDKSPLYTTTIATNDDIMPPKGKLDKSQSDILKLWIEQGANWPDGVKLAKVHRVDFVKEIQPIIEADCVTCHKEGHAKGGVALDAKATAFHKGEKPGCVIPFNLEKSTFYTTITTNESEDLMPPKKKGGPLSKEKIELVKQWIEQGAVWPDDVKITAKAKSEGGGAAEKAIATTAEIFKRVTAANDVKSEADMKEYTATIPGSDVQFTMLPIKGGEFVMGSPESEAGRKADEGPQHKVKISPFWMEKCLITWNEYEMFMLRDEEKKMRAKHKTDAEADKVADEIARPSQPYVDMTFGMGRDGFPAISMTHHAASQYCKWLSAKTGQFYRLPTEAEWEYACRAGTKTAYFFGDDASKLDEYAWSVANSDGATKKVGQKKANPWGLYDMSGLLWQWTLDGLSPYTAADATDPYVRATKPYPHATRGGSWQDKADRLRSAARRGSDPVWKVQDPQLPKSIWYHTDAQFVGFRIVRPLALPATAEDAHKIWHSGVEKGD